MSFGEVVNGYKKKEKGEWKIKSVLGEVQKNKSDIIKITKVEYLGTEYINLQVWRKNLETDTIYPIKEQKMIFNINLKDQIIDILEDC